MKNNPKKEDSLFSIITDWIMFPVEIMRCVNNIAKWFLFAIAIIILIMFTSSCEVSKQFTKDKVDNEKITNTDIVLDKESTTKTITERTVEGGEINTTIPPEDERERDENGLLKDLIQEIKEGGLTKTIHYKPDGSVDVDCRLAEMFERIQKENVERDNSIINIMENLEVRLLQIEKNKEKSVDDSAVLIVVLVVGALITIMFMIMMWQMKQQGKVFSTIANKIIGQTV